MSAIGALIGLGIMPSGNKHGTTQERMEYWQKIWIRSGYKSVSAEEKFKQYMRELYKQGG